MERVIYGTKIRKAADWLRRFLNQRGGRAPVSDIVLNGKRNGLQYHHLYSARKKIGVVSVRAFPRDPFRADGRLVLKTIQIWKFKDDV